METGRGQIFDAIECVRFKAEVWLGKPVIVAGGAIRDALMGNEPKDIDLFVVGDVNTEMFPAEVEVLRDNDECLYRIFVRWEGDIDGHRVQIMSHPAATGMEALCDCFDWDVCRFAWDGVSTFEGMKVADIGPGKTLNLHRVTFPASTLRRGFRIEERFGMKAARSTLQLIAMQFAMYGWRIDWAEAEKVHPYKAA